MKRGLLSEAKSQGLSAHWLWDFFVGMGVGGLGSTTFLVALVSSLAVSVCWVVCLWAVVTPVPRKSETVLSIILSPKLGQCLEHSRHLENNEGRNK